MAGKAQSRVVQNKMEVITESIEEESTSCSKKNVSKKQVIISYKSYESEDISNKAVGESRTEILTNKNKNVGKYNDDNNQFDANNVSNDYRTNSDTSTRIITNRKHINDDDNHQYDDADDSDNYTSSTGTSRTSNSSDDDDIDDDDDDDDTSLDELNTSQTSSLELKFEKQVDLFAEHGHETFDPNEGYTSIMSEYFEGEIKNGMLNGPMSPVSKYPQNDVFQNFGVYQPLSPVSDNRVCFLEVKPAVIEATNLIGVTDHSQPMSPDSDNRVSVLEVKQAIIETSNTVGTNEPLSCEVTDPGPEIKKAMLLETDIDSIAKIDYNDTCDLDYKVIGGYHEVSKVSSSESKDDVENSNKTKVSKHESQYSKAESYKPAAKDKAKLGKKNIKSRGLKTVDEDVEKMNKKNSAIVEAQDGKIIAGEFNKTQTTSPNSQTTGISDKTQMVTAQSNKNMSGLSIDHYKITEKTETTSTQVTKKTESQTILQGSDKINKQLIKDRMAVVPVPSKNDTDTIKMNSIVADSVSSKSNTKSETVVVGTDVTMRETRGRDMSKVRRELKLDIPNNHNNNKTALLDQLLLSSDMSQGIGVCCRCGEGFGTHQQIVNSNGEVWHPQCFVCAQCFQPFPEGIFYEYEGRKYCEHDFHVLFAPCCGKCSEFIVGRVIKAMNNAWHPDCFRCQLCTGPLADAGFVKNAGRALCRECNAKEKARGLGKYVCHKCHSIIEEGHIKYKGEAYHPYHFNCKNCGIELNADAREVNGELYCLRCHDKMGIPICGACRRPIEERVVHALGKAWHVEHFVCAKCEKPFFGTRHYEKKGLAYCEVHYHQLFGNICFVCNTVISGDVFHAFNKAWHVKCFACSICDRKMSQKTKFFEFDLKPVCKFCYEKFPGELKKRLKKAYEEQGSKK